MNGRPPTPARPPRGANSPPPPPMYQAGADIPPDSPYHYSSAPSRRTTGGIGAGLLAALAAAWAYGKYILLVALKFPAFATLLTGLVSVGAYAFIYPWQVA